MANKTQVIYKDIAVGAKENAVVTSDGSTEESTPQSLPAGVSPGSVIALEHNRWLLNGTFDAYYEDGNIAFWSSELSDDTGAFTADPVITFSFSEQFSCMGITLNFNESTGEYCSLVNVKWYQGETLKVDQDFTPNSADYFCSRKVESFDKIILTLKETSIPNRRAKLNGVVFGVIRTFEMNELRSASIVNEMNEVSLELPVSTMKWTLDSLSDVEYMFQLKQPVEVRNNGNLLGVYYIDSASRKAARVYDVDCHDALGVLSESQFPGGAYLSGISAKTLLETLFAPFAVEYADGVADATLKGVLPAQTKRDAIQQVAFAWGVCLATDGGESLRVFALPSAPEIIPKGRTYTGAAVETSAIVTSVSVTAHTYTASADGSIEINGQKYDDTQTVYTVTNPDVTASDRENTKEVTGATLVSADIGQAVAQRVYNYYLKRDTNSAQIVYNGEKLGDCLSIYTPWDSLVTGNLQKMEITLSNTVAYKAEVSG